MDDPTSLVSLAMSAGNLALVGLVGILTRRKTRLAQELAEEAARVAADAKKLADAAASATSKASRSARLLAELRAGLAECNEAHERCTRDVAALKADVKKLRHGLGRFSVPPKP